MIRVWLPAHLRPLAHLDREAILEVSPPVTLQRVLDALEAKYPMLRGTIRDPFTFRRRDFMRFFACQQDLSLQAPDVALPEPVAAGLEPLRIVGAIAGG